MAAVVDLGSLPSFAVFAGTTVTNAGVTSITGNVGVSPGTALTGLAGVALNGNVHAGDAVAQQAATDWATAFAAGNAATCTTDLSGQDLGGRTLTAGSYCFTSSAQLTGVLTLDTAGDPAAQFLFKIGSALTTASAASIAWVGGNGTDELLWLVGSSATFGTTTAFSGSILAATAITFDTGASLTRGRALAGAGAVTLDSATISIVGRPAIDDPGGVPEPGTWALLLTGFAMIGAALRHKNVVDAKMSLSCNFLAQRPAKV